MLSNRYYVQPGAVSKYLTIKEIIFRPSKVKYSLDTI